MNWKQAWVFIKHIAEVGRKTLHSQISEILPSCVTDLLTLL